MGQGTKLFILALLLAALGYAGYKTFVPQPTGVAAAQKDLEDCPNGTKACPHNCLKREDEGWTSMHVDGHPDTDVWMKFGYEGNWQAYNQGHIGHVIEQVNGKYVDTGVCPICRGTTKVCQ